MCLQKSGLPLCRGRCVIFDLFDHRKLASDILDVVAQFELQISLFTSLANWNSNAACHISVTLSCPPHFPSWAKFAFLWDLNDYGWFWVEPHDGGTEENESDKQGLKGRTEEPRQLWHVWPWGQLWLYEMRAEAGAQVDNVRLGITTCLALTHVYVRIRCWKAEEWRLTNPCPITGAFLVVI